jgi:glycosyltransferase involved in cell wall biosynthesis
MNVVASSLALREHGIDSTIVSTDMAGAVSAREHNRLNPGDLPPGADQLDLRIVRARWPQRLAFAPEMVRVLDREVRRCDAVHIHMLFMFPQWAAYRAAMRRGVPYIVSPCGALDPHLRGRSRLAKLAVDVAWQRRMLDGAAAIHFKTPEEAAAAADFGFAAPSVVVPNGVSLEEFAAMPSRQAFRDRHLSGFDGPLVLHLGRLSHK